MIEMDHLLFNLNHVLQVGQKHGILRPSPIQRIALDNQPVTELYAAFSKDGGIHRNSRRQTENIVDDTGADKAFANRSNDKGNRILIVVVG